MVKVRARGKLIRLAIGIGESSGSGYNGWRRGGRGGGDGGGADV